MNEFLVKLQNSSMERRNRVLKLVSGMALLWPGMAILCPGLALLFPVYYTFLTVFYIKETTKKKNKKITKKKKNKKKKKKKKKNPFFSRVRWCRSYLKKKIWGAKIAPPPPQKKPFFSWMIFLYVLMHKNTFTWLYGLCIHKAVVRY